MIHYLDTSVLVKAYDEEERSEDVWELLERGANACMPCGQPAGSVAVDDRPAVAAVHFATTSHGGVVAGWIPINLVN